MMEDLKRNKCQFGFRRLLPCHLSTYNPLDDVALLNYIDAVNNQQCKESQHFDHNGNASRQIL